MQLESHTVNQAVNVQDRPAMVRAGVQPGKLTACSVCRPHQSGVYKVQLPTDERNSARCKDHLCPTGYISDIMFNALEIAERPETESLNSPYPVCVPKTEIFRPRNGRFNFDHGNSQVGPACTDRNGIP